MMSNTASKLTAAQLKEMWAKTDWDNPFESHGEDSKEFLDFLYDTQRSPEVVEMRFKSLKFKLLSGSDWIARSSLKDATEDASEILDYLPNYARREAVRDWYEAHKDEAEEAFNVWWWEQHDISDYVDEEGAL